MNITVFGASGKVGQLVVKRLIDQGHSVQAFVHGTAPFAESDQLTIVKGDVHSAEDIARALHGADAVISCLGSWRTPTKDILSSAMRHIAPEMQRRGIKRIVSLTGAAARAPHEQFRLRDRLNRRLLMLAARDILVDGEEHLRLLAESDLDWTVLRSPVMSNRAASGYRLRDVPGSPFETISRQTVATAMVDQLEDKGHLCSAVQLRPRRQPRT